MQQVAGHLQEKKGYYYVVLNYKDENGKRKSKWISTKLTVKGNKKKAESMLAEIRREFTIPTIAAETKPSVNKSSNEMANMLFADYMIYWLDIIKPNVAISTFTSYTLNVKSVIAPYFREKKITLGELQPKDIQEFYTEKLKKVKANSVHKYHANIRKALVHAVKMDYILVNPIFKVEKPKKQPYFASFYTIEEVEKLFEVAKDTYLNIPIIMASFYGMRRGEVSGLRWKAVDFESNTISVNHVITKATIDGETKFIGEDKAKSDSSVRTYPLVGPVKEKLLQLKEQQEMYVKKFKRSYNKKYLDYICVDEMGELITPSYITSAFPTLLRNNNMRHIRFHDLRHTCASLLLKSGVPMKQIQDWLGHSDFSTTANIYAHLEYDSKLSSASAMLGTLNLNI